MQFDLPFLDELRLMFMEGATPSHLIRHIANRHAEEDNLHGLVQTCFFHAFGVGPVRISRKHDLTQLDEDVFGALNDSLIFQMIENYPEWGTHLAMRIEPFWKDLGAISAGPKPAPETIAELAKSWSQLDSPAQNFIRRILSNLDEAFLKVQILARLAERQERQIAELEQHIPPPPVHK